MKYISGFVIADIFDGFFIRNITISDVNAPKIRAIGARASNSANDKALIPTAHARIELGINSTKANGIAAMATPVK